LTRVILGQLVERIIYGQEVIIRLGGRESGFVELFCYVPSAVPIRDGRKPRVLLAEDNAVNIALALAMLNTYGCDTEVVGNGAKAVEACAQREFDLVLMDCQMPEMDGFEATRRIRAREAASSGGLHIPVIALTANAMEGDRGRCIAAGMDDYLSKPFKRDQLYQMLARWLDQESARPGDPPASLSVQA